MAAILPTLQHGVYYLPSLLAACVLLVAGKWVFDRTLPYRFDEETGEKRNPAFAILLGGYLLGLAFAVSGAFFGREEGSPWTAAAKLLGDGAIAIALVRLGIWINDTFVLSGFAIEKEIREDQNWGVGFCVGGSCVASGLIVQGALMGFSANYWQSWIDILIYWINGQILLCLGGWIYRRIKTYDVHQLIEFDDNAAVGINFGGFLVAVGILVQASLVGSGLDSLGNELLRTWMLAGFGILALAGVHYACVAYLFSNLDVSEEIEMKRNLTIGIIMASFTIGMASVLAMVFQR